MEINVGDYVRTNLGIGTVHRFYNDNGDCYVRFSKNVIKKWVTITKHSKDIIELVEVKDIVIINILENNFDWNKGIITMPIYSEEVLLSLKENVKTNNCEILEILTHEQFEANAYKIENKLDFDKEVE